ncbi:hypothetical protein [Vibrio splendidus]|uniref:hypothetical protein n=1 Tax=Vibrio TaxID=662 RepID=UPI0013B3D755|nr:hypothetical protein [Vibrio splendidus]
MPFFNWYHPFLTGVFDYSVHHFGYGFTIREEPPHAAEIPDIIGCVDGFTEYIEK